MRTPCKLTIAVTALTVFTTFPAASAHNAHHLPRHNKRQGGVYDPLPIASITSGAPTPPAAPLATTYTAGAQPPLTGAPPLPTYTKNLANWPPQNQIPPIDSPEVQQWLRELDGETIPNIPVNSDISDPNGDLCQLASQAARDNAVQNAWWTCGSHMAEGDVSVCPTRNDWGLSFDDGPSDQTPKLLKWLDDHDLKATFFVVGSMVIQRPDVVRAMHMEGHQISVHTWSHRPLTMLTNAEIVAELGWTRQAIQEITGVSPTSFRPPRGDVDNRVRAVARAMGMTDILWTVTPEGEILDSEDFRVVAGQINGVQAFSDFQQLLGRTTSLNSGFIVLQHDLHFQTVDLAIGSVLPYALTQGFSLKTINQCLGLPEGAAYIETQGDTNPPSGGGGGSPSGTPTNSGTGSSRPTRTSSRATSGSSTPTQSTNGAILGRSVSFSASGQVMAGAAAGVVAFFVGLVQVV